LQWQVLSLLVEVEVEVEVGVEVEMKVVWEGVVLKGQAFDMLSQTRSPCCWHSPLWCSQVYVDPQD
jgi:hypothetical protein